MLHLLGGRLGLLDTGANGGCLGGWLSPLFCSDNDQDTSIATVDYCML